MVTNEWYDETLKIIVQTLSGDWTWTEIIESNHTEVQQMMQSVEHPVHVIVVLEQGFRLPLGSAITSGIDAVESLPDTLGLLILVSPLRYIRVIGNIVSSMATATLKRNLKIAKSVNDAVMIINKYTAENDLD